ncbi:MAG: Ig-like domain-containing protein, partial [Candidatus Zixiibacteriota bacterium]
MKEEKNSRYRISLALFVFALILSGAAPSSIGSQTEAIYVDTSISSTEIYNEANSHGAPDGNDAYVSAPLANRPDTWTFGFANTAYSSASFDSAHVHISHWASAHENDILVLEYFDGSNWNIFETFDSSNPLPVSRTTSGPFSAGLITSWSQVDGFQARLRGIQKVGGSDVITYYVDAIELRVFYTGNQPPELDSIGSKSVAEGATLEFRIHATDPDLDAITLDTSGVPLNATFVDSGNGAGSFTFTPGYDQSGVYYVTFIASDGSLADSEVVEITVNDVNQAPVVADIPDQTIPEGSSFATIDLDDYVSDVDHADSEMVWTYSGNSELSVDITDRVATISPPDADWSGSESITFRATDPGSLYDEDGATFT